MSLITYLKATLRQLVSGQGDEPRPEPEDSLAMPPVSALDRKMPIEVMKDFDAVLLFGKLAAGGPGEMAIGRIPGEADFPVCQTGSGVLVRGYDDQASPILLLGRVVYSSPAQCVVGELKRIPYETPRKSIRYPLTPPSGTCILEQPDSELPQPCQLLNISASGACIVTDRSYQAGQPLRLQIRQDGGAGRVFVYHCRVVRAAPRGDGGFEYGLLFTQMDKISRGRLIRSIQAIRREMEQKLLP